MSKTREAAVNVGSQNKITSLSNSEGVGASGAKRGKEKDKSPLKKCKHCGVEVQDILHHLKVAHPISVQCNKCGKTVSDIKAHLSADHPPKGQNQTRAAKNETLINSAVKELDSQLASIADVKKEMSAELKELRQDPKPKEVSSKDRLNQMRDDDQLQQYSDNSGPCPGLELKFKTKLRTGKWVESSKRPNRLVLSDHLQCWAGDLEDSLFSLFDSCAAFVTLILQFVLMWLLGWFRDFSPPEGYTLVHLIAFRIILFSLFWLFYDYVVKNRLRTLSVAWQKAKAAFGCGSKAWQEFWLEAPWSPVEAQSWYETCCTRRLVAIPVKDLPRGSRFFPDFDAEDKKFAPTFRKYQLAVEYKFMDTVMYSIRSEGFPEQWVSGSRPALLKTVVLSEGLISTTINRKTMLGSRGDPAVNLGVMLRLLSANPHYAESPHYVARGRSIYRDMALVCGAIVTRDPFHDNQHF